MLYRNIDPSLMDTLRSYIASELENPGTPQSWYNFYHFILKASETDQMSRPSVSQLSILLKEQQIKEHASLAVLYAHGIYVLALGKGLKIYGEGINP